MVLVHLVSVKERMETHTKQFPCNTSYSNIDLHITWTGFGYQIFYYGILLWNLTKDFQHKDHTTCCNSFVKLI